MGRRELPDLRTAAEAIGLRKDASTAAVAGALRSRGDDMLARLILEAFDIDPDAAAPDVKDIADLLGF